MSNSEASDVDLARLTCASSGQCSHPAARSTTAECVAKRKPASTVSGEQSDRQLSAVLAGRQARS
jgi:hypothetical protein